MPLQMLKHGRAGVPLEVMGLMLGEFVDDYTVCVGLLSDCLLNPWRYRRVIDVFAMPQSGTGVSVEAVDPVYQTKMMDMLKQTGRYECYIVNEAKANFVRQSRNGRWLVSLASRIWLLVVKRGRQHATSRLPTATML